MRVRSRATAGLAAAFAFLAATSCDAPSGNDADRVGQIVMTPNSATLQAGSSISLSATVLSASGSALRDRRVLWASENEAVATVSQSGVVVAVAAGVVRIAASSGGKSASATITVDRRPVSLVRITPGSATISVGSTVALQAEALDATGSPVTGRPITWRSSDEAVALVSSQGVVVGVASGAVTISATIDGRAGTAGIAVAPQPVAGVVITPLADSIVIGRRVTFRAWPVDAQNEPLSDRIVLWASNNPLVATVSSDGEVIGLAIGNARIRATVEGKFADATIVVQQVPVARIAVAPNELTLTPGQTSQLSVTLSDSAGNVLTGRSVAYASSAAQIVSVTASGLISAIVPGTAQIDVTSEGKSAAVAVTVNPIPIASIGITPNAATVRMGQSTRLVAQAFDAGGAPLTSRTFTWSSASASVATVNQSGDVTAVGTGTASISAASEGQVGTATIAVVTAPVAAIVISPKPVSVLPNATQQLTVQLFDSAGNQLSQAGRPINWVSRSPAIATVSGSGLVTGVTTGNTRVIVATAGASISVLDSVDVTVPTAGVSSVVLQPRSHAQHVGDIRALRAVVSSSGSVVRGRNVAWQSRAPLIATVTPVAGWPDSAVVVGVLLGSTYVVATESGLRDSALITVSALPGPTVVASVVVTPATASIVVNATAQLNAEAKDSAGGTLARAITWVSRTPNVVSVSATGLATAVSPGSATIEARANGAGVNAADVVGTASVTATQPVQTLAPVHSVTVTSPRSAIVRGDTMHLTVVLRDNQNNILTGRPITFTSSSTSRMTVDGAGVVTGVGSSGKSDISATSEGQSAKVQIDAVDAIATISVVGPQGGPLDLLIPRNTKKVYTVTVEDSRGRGVNNATISISTNNPNLLTLSKATLSTNSSGQAKVDISAGSAQGLALIQFTAFRAGAIPPATAGSNNLAARLLIAVP